MSGWNDGLPTTWEGIFARALARARRKGLTLTKPIIDEAEQRRITRRIEAKRAYDAYSKHEAQRLKECRERMERAL